MFRASHFLREGDFQGVRSGEGNSSQDGAACTTPFVANLAPTKAKLHTDPDIIVKRLSGKEEKVYSTGEVTLAVGNFRQHRRGMVAFDMWEPKFPVHSALRCCICWKSRSSTATTWLNLPTTPNRFH
jgi:hypothetical protein